MFDQHIRQTVKAHNASQVRFPINLGPINKNLSDFSKRPNMLLRSQLKPVQRPAEGKPISIKEVIESQLIELISDK